MHQSIIIIVIKMLTIIIKVAAIKSNSLITIEVTIGFSNYEPNHYYIVVGHHSLVFY